MAPTVSSHVLIAEPHPDTPSNQRREARIRELDALIGDYEACAEVADYFFWMGEADRARLKRDALIGEGAHA
jgi:hypothetical protein